MYRTGIYCFVIADARNLPFARLGFCYFPFEPVEGYRFWKGIGSI